MTVLVVDDDENILAICVSILRARQAEVVTARGVEEAKDQLKNKSNRVDLLITDVCLSFEDEHLDLHSMKYRAGGIALTQWCRENFPGIPVVLMSAFVSFSAQDLSAMGVSGFIPKPIHVDRLIEAVGPFGTGHAR